MCAPNKPGIIQHQCLDRQEVVDTHVDQRDASGPHGHSEVGTEMNVGVSRQGGGGVLGYGSTPAESLSAADAGYERRVILDVLAVMRSDA
jgi:hypothetical protein